MCSSFPNSEQKGGVVLPTFFGTEAVHFNKSVSEASAAKPSALQMLDFHMRGNCDGLAAHLQPYIKLGLAAWAYGLWLQTLKPKLHTVD